ncbi:MAG: hypothetical protein KA137_11525, partial [Halioglobus sp.]|nr:hypothetical protein [Halioglobus sp.]
MSQCEHEKAQQAVPVASCCATEKVEPSCHGSAAAKADSCCGTPAAAAPSCHGEMPAATDSCCETPVKRDYFLWGCVLIVASAWLAGAMFQHDHESALGMFTGGVFDLFNQMWWGIAIGIVFVGILGRVPRDLVMGILGRDGGLGGLCR